MSDYIVLVKQVPDVSQITDNAFDPDTGTLIRTRLASVINELDTHALAYADHMRNLSGQPGRIITLTMGPPMAAEVLKYSLSRAADQAVLLTDRALGGADTVATANPLAFAIKKIVTDLLDNSKDYFVISGMQSVDGDTAQVPPQIAEQLKIPCIGYVTDVEYKKNKFQFKRIISGGTQTVMPKKAPAVITVAKYEYPLFASFKRTRWANDLDIIQWTNEDIKAKNIGVKGSKTRVIRVFPPEKSKRKCLHINTPKEFAKAIIDSCKNTDDAITVDENNTPNYILPTKRQNFYDRHFEGTQKEIEDFQILAQKIQQLEIDSPEKIDDVVRQKILDVAGEHFHKKALEDMINGLTLKKTTYTGQVWVMAEHRNAKLHPATFELIGKARQLADSLDTKVGVCLAGKDVKPLAKQLIHAGADDIYLIENDYLEHFDPTACRKVVADVVKTYSPQIMLFAATPQGRLLAPMVSYRLKCGLTADCTSLDIRDSSRKSQIATLYQTRPALGGNVMATICTKDSKSQMATARPGVMKSLKPDTSRTGKIINHEVKLSARDISLKILDTQLAAGSVNFDADAVVSGGKGLTNKAFFSDITASLCQTLKDTLGISVEQGASRAAVEQGYIDRIHQVGQTGTAIGPKMYFAIAISGAIQHMIGVANAQNIFAVNNDPNAPILKNCDYYMVGSAEDLIPQIIEQLNLAEKSK